MFTNLFILFSNREFSQFLWLKMQFSKMRALKLVLLEMSTKIKYAAHMNNLLAQKPFKNSNMTFKNDNLA